MEVHLSKDLKRRLTYLFSMPLPVLAINCQRNSVFMLSVREECDHVVSWLVKFNV